MEKLNAFYFSGTGNTRFVVERLCGKLAGKYIAKLYDVAENRDFSAELNEADAVLLGFPIYGSAPPIPMRRFIFRYAKEFAGKRVIIAETQYFFSGDGAASLGRTLASFGAVIVGAEHFNMPNNLADVKIFPIRNGAENAEILARAEKRIDAFASRILQGKRKKRGFRLLPHAVGYLCQRKFWRKDEAGKRSKLCVSKECVGCGLCVKNCPVENLILQGKRAHPLGKCVLCYRCVNLCPKRAITLFGSAPPAAQYKGPNV